MDELNIICKLCGSENVIKFGIQADTQMYFCKSCQRKFKGDDSLFHSKVPANNITSALSMYYGGMSLNDIRNNLKQENPDNYMPSSASVYDWIYKYSDKAVKYYDQFQPKVGDIWIADETNLDIDGKNVWLWDIIDAETRYLLATKMSYTRTTQDAQTLFELAKKKAGKSPKVIITDGLPAYVEAVEVFGKGIEHKRSRPFTDKENSTNLIERWHSTLKERTKVLRGLKDTESALAFIDGFLAYYNFIRPHESLDNKTPAEEAKIIYPIKNWAELARLENDKYIVKAHSIAELPEHLEITGNPDAKRGGWHKGDTYQDIKERKRKATSAKANMARVKLRKARIKKNRQAGYTKATQTIAMVITPRKKNAK